MITVPSVIESGLESLLPKRNTSHSYRVSALLPNSLGGVSQDDAALIFLIGMINWTLLLEHRNCRTLSFDIPSIRPMNRINKKKRYLVQCFADIQYWCILLLGMTSLF